MFRCEQIAARGRPGRLTEIYLDSAHGPMIPCCWSFLHARGRPQMKWLAEVLLLLAAPVNGIPAYGDDSGPSPLAVALLGDRTRVSTSIPLDPLSWTFTGPAPNVDHDPSTGYVEN